MGHNLPKKFEVTKVSQSTAGLTVPASGVLPVYYDAAAGRYLPAQADSTTTAADTIVTHVGTNRITIQEDGLLNCRAHGLTVGKWYVLDPDNPGAIITKDTLNSLNLQYICFVVDDDSILLRLDPMFILEEVPEDVELVNGWNTGTTVTVAPGDDRLLVVAVTNEVPDDDPGDVPVIANTVVTIGGQTGTLAVAEEILSGFTNQIYLYYWTEAQIAAFSGTTLSISYDAPVDETTFAHAIYENVDQTTPVEATDTDNANGSPVSLGGTVNVGEGTAAIWGVTSGNAGVTVTDNSLDSPLAGTMFDGVSHSGETGYWIVPTGGTRTANITITGGNRQALAMFSMRRAP